MAAAVSSNNRSSLSSSGLYSATTPSCAEVETRADAFLAIGRPGTCVPRHWSSVRKASDNGGDRLHGTTCEICSVTCRKLLSLLPVDIARQHRGTLRRSDPSFGTGLAFSELFDSVPSFPQGGRFRRKLSEKKLRSPSPPSMSAASFACTPQRPMEI